MAQPDDLKLKAAVKEAHPLGSGLPFFSISLINMSRKTQIIRQLRKTANTKGRDKKNNNNKAAWKKPRQ